MIETILKDCGQRIVVLIRTDNVTVPAVIDRNHDMLDPSRDTKEFVFVVFNLVRYL